MDVTNPEIIYNCKQFPYLNLLWNYAKKDSNCNELHVQGDYTINTETAYNSGQFPYLNSKSQNPKKHAFYIYAYEYGNCLEL